MNPTIHSKLSVKRFGGKIDDYHHIHSFMDSSKEVEPTNLHRCLTHHLWFVKNVVIPIFGSNFKNSENKDVDVKDLCELDHILPDFGNKFIPSISDYFDLLSTDESFIKEVEQKINNFVNSFASIIIDKCNNKFDSISNLMISPFNNTGNRRSLLLTHNSWFIGNILPKIFPEISCIDFLNMKDNIPPSFFLNNLKYDSWIQNGLTYPKSHEKVKKYRDTKEQKIENSILLDVHYDGAKENIPLLNKDGSLNLGGIKNIENKPINCNLEELRIVHKNLKPGYLD